MTLRLWLRYTRRSVSPTIEIRNALNAGVLPSDYFAVAEQDVNGRSRTRSRFSMEATYQTTWSKSPAIVRRLVEPHL